MSEAMQIALIGAVATVGGTLAGALLGVWMGAKVSRKQALELYQRQREDAKRDAHETEKRQFAGLLMRVIASNYSDIQERLAELKHFVEHHIECLTPELNKKFYMDYVANAGEPLVSGELDTIRDRAKRVVLDYPRMGDLKYHLLPSSHAGQSRCRLPDLRRESRLPGVPARDGRGRVGAGAAQRAVAS